MPHRVFRKLLKKHALSEASSDDQEVDPSPMIFKEGNALRYAAGYVCRTVQKNIQSS